MVYVSDPKALTAAKNADFQGESLVISVAVAIAESHDPTDPQARIRSDAVNTAGNTPPSRDRGAWQLNDHWHPEVSDACAFDLQCAAKAAYKISANGHNFSPWVTYTTGAYLAYMPRVRKALAAMASKIAYPFAGTYPLTQKYGITDFAGEPPGYLYPDGSLDYFTNNGTAVRYNHLHAGLDFGCPTGTPILAVADGVVSFAGQDQTGFGNCIKVNHPALGLTSLYGHLQSFTVKQGQAVKAGQQIALSNNTGNSDGAHIHLSLIRNSDGHYIDPSPYLSTTPVKPPKPADSVHFVNFKARTMVGTTRLYLGPHTKTPILGELNPGTVVNFEAWCWGEARWDFAAKQWDRRFYLAVSPDKTGSGWVSSSRVNGNAPESSA